MRFLFSQPMSAHDHDRSHRPRQHSICTPPMMEAHGRPFAGTEGTAVHTQLRALYGDQFLFHHSILHVLHRDVVLLFRRPRCRKHRVRPRGQHIHSRGPGRTSRHREGDRFHRPQEDIARMHGPRYGHDAPLLRIRHSGLHLHSQVLPRDDLRCGRLGHKHHGRRRSPHVQKGRGSGVFHAQLQLRLRRRTVRLHVPAEHRDL